MNNIFSDSTEMQRLASEVREKANAIRSLKKRDELILKAEEIEAYVSLQKWANSSGLKVPD